LGQSMVLSVGQMNLGLVQESVLQPVNWPVATEPYLTAMSMLHGTFKQTDKSTHGTVSCIMLGP
jgi:hypothetical protein